MGRLTALATGVSKAGFASRDENSSIGATVTRRTPSGPGQRPTLNTRSGHFAGRTRGVGRKEAKDENSSPRVTSVQPRHPNGRWVSHENDLKVYHPDSQGHRPRQPHTSALGIHRKEGGPVSRAYKGKAPEPSPRGGKLVTKADDDKLVVTTGVDTGHSMRQNTRFGSAGSRGRRLP